MVVFFLNLNLNQTAYTLHVHTHRDSVQIKTNSGAKQFPFPESLCQPDECTRASLRQLKKECDTRLPACSHCLKRSYTWDVSLPGMQVILE